METTKKHSELVSAEYLKELYGVSMPTIRRWAKTGVIPPPMRIGRRLLRWKLSEIESHFENGNKE